jgi:hypothetical protein
MSPTVLINKLKVGSVPLQGGIARKTLSVSGTKLTIHGAGSFSVIDLWKVKPVSEISYISNLRFKLERIVRNLLSELTSKSVI